MNTLYFPLYIAWAITWSLVMVEYARAAHWSWREDGGRWAVVPLLPFRFVRWYFTSLADDVLHWWRTDTPPIVEPAHSGRWLRFAVGLSAFNMGVTGLATSLVDRSMWPWWQHALVFGGVTVSLVAAQIHLALAWTRHPRRWRIYSGLLLAWMPLGLWLRLTFF